MPSFVIPSIFKAIDKFSPVVKSMSGSVDAFAARAERKLRGVSKAAEQIGQGAGIVGAAIAAPLILAADAAIKFEAGMSNVATLLDTNKENMSSMGEQVLNLAKTLPIPIEELTQSLYDIRSSGIGADRAMKVLEISGKLSAAGLATAAESTNILTSAMNAFSADGLTTEQTADFLFKTVKAGKTTLSQLAQAFGATAPIVQSAGATLADFQAATAALTLSGTPAAQAQNQIKASMISLMKPTAELEKIMNKLGVKTSAELIKKSGGMVGAFRKINDVGVKMGTNMAKAWGSTEALAAVTPLLDAASTAGVAYTGALNDMLKGSNAVDSAFEKQSQTSKAQLQLAKNNIEALSVSIGAVLLPVLNKLIQTIVPMAQKFGAWAKENPRLFKGLIIGAAAVAALALTISGLAFTVSIVSKGIMLFGMAAKAVTAAQWLWNAAMTANPIGLIIVGVAALIALIAAIIVYWNDWGAALSLFLGPLGMIISLFMAFKNNWDMIKEAFKTDGILGGLKAIGKTLIDSILAPLQQLLEIVAKVTGSDMAANAAKSIAAFRAEMGVNVEGGAAAAGTPAVNTEKDKQDALVQKMESTQNAKVEMTINDKNNRTTAKTDNPKIINIKSETTTGFSR